MPPGLLDKTTISIQVAQEFRRRILAGHYPQGIKLQQEQIAAELGVNAGAHGSAEQNIALHKAVMRKLAENGGRVPDALKD